MTGKRDCNGRRVQSVKDNTTEDISKGPVTRKASNTSANTFEEGPNSGLLDNKDKSVKHQASSMKKEQRDDPDYFNDSRSPKRPKTTAASFKPKASITKQIRYCEDLAQDLQRLSKLVDDHKTLKKRATELRKSKSSLTSERNLLNAEVRRFHQKTDRLQDKNSQQSSEFHQALAEQEKKFTDAIQELQASRTKDLFEPLPDDVLRDQFGIILDKCAQWARDWCSLEPDNGEKPVVNRIITDCLPEGSENSIIPPVHHFLKKKPIASKILVAAKLSRCIFDHYLGNPFFMLDMFPHRKGLGESLHSAYQCLRDGKLSRYELFVPVFWKPDISIEDISKACRWRGDTLRSFADYLYVANNPPNSRALENRPFLEQYLESQVRDFSLECIDLLKPVTPNRLNLRQEEVVSIFAKMAQLSMHLWCQKLDIQVSSNSSLFQQKFSTKSKILKSHPTMGLDEDSNDFHGKHIDLVVVPAVSAVGNAEGDHFDSSKVWSKAIVLIFEDEDTPAEIMEDNRTTTASKQKCLSDSETGTQHNPIALDLNETEIDQSEMKAIPNLQLSECNVSIVTEYSHDQTDIATSAQTSPAQPQSDPLLRKSNPNVDDENQSAKRLLEPSSWGSLSTIQRFNLRNQPLTVAETGKRCISNSMKEVACKTEPI